MAHLRAIPSSGTYVRAAGVGVAVLVAGLLGACSGSASGGGTTTTPPVTHTATATVTHSAPAPTTSADNSDAEKSSSPGGSKHSHSGGSSSSGNGSSSSLAYCKESQLRASIDNSTIPGNNTHGERAVIVDFVNTSDSSCDLYGYPGAAIISDGKQYKQATRTIRGRLLGFAPGHNTLVHVTLKPGAVATAGIEGTSQRRPGSAHAGCGNAPYPSIVVTPPNTRTPVPFDVSWPICYSFTVHPVNYKS